MTLQDKLMEDYKAAMKARDGVKKNTLSFVRAAIKQLEVDKRKEVSEEEILNVLAKQVKMRRDAIAEFQKGKREDLIDSYTAEIEVLEEYLPKQLSAEEIKNIVSETADEMGLEPSKQNMGKLMGAVMGKVKGVADGNKVRKIIEEHLDN